MTRTDATNFIEMIAPIIQKLAKTNGYKLASPIIAQACIESAYNKSSLGYKYHNYFGMKTGGSWKGKSVNLLTKEEYTVGALTTVTSAFRVYDTVEEGVQGYFDFIKANRYSNLKKAKTPKEYLENIKADGYCTSSTYVYTCLNVINRYDLEKYDNFENVTINKTKPTITIETNPFKEPTTIVKIGTKGNNAYWVQWWLWRFGLLNKEDIDGIIGTKSLSAIIESQRRLGLTIDGKVGKITRSVYKRTLVL